MSSTSVRSAGRSAKTAKRPAKKAAKIARASATKASKAARSKSAVARSRHSAVAEPIAAHAEQLIRAPSPPVQPKDAISLPRRMHKYQVGEMVYYTSPSFGRAAATGSYTVVKLLPSEGDDYQYRIKSSGEAFERVAKESQLERI